ncbi:iron-sulfur cluster assembly accessory protein [Candidatus Blochmannia ocreatus (nom. nud.)]|uniref:Iron-sulfur cluster assembly accessory protein n=1 Tax=Candidatus Blochmannia ocreatus (nom. nud.) TaxID=251538 RepID=A0ABY4SY07_9ENTR|nr:iron-sulfur cluster assembly accessory protein [Candidatus Blochmannia ocreatus]URJ24867.1 iron-sulfur cluster assembly accessory protein [Candidatus Blochmannia ocreatus]
MKIQKSVKYNIYSGLKKNTAWNGIKLTNSAIKQILHIIEKDPTILGLKINIKKSGCAGFTYIMETVKTLNDDDLTYKINSIKLFIPHDKMPFIDGTEIDYVKEGLNYTFKFNNPQARNLCGCGESFNI